MNKIQLCNLAIVEKFKYRILFINYSSILTDNFSQNLEKQIAFSVKKKNCIHRIKLELNTLMKCNIDGSKCFLF